MKKFLILLIFLLVITLTAGATDLSGMTIEQLTDLHISVMDELKSRTGITSISAPSGTYEAGVDFPSGSYVIKNVTNDEFSFSYVQTYYTKIAWQALTSQIEVDNLELIKYSGATTMSVLNYQQEVTVKANPGTIIVLNGADFIMTPHVGLTINTK